MATVDGEVTSKTPKQRVIAFGAQLSPDFLVPSNLIGAQKNFRNGGCTTENGEQ